MNLLPASEESSQPAATAAVQRLERGIQERELILDFSIAFTLWSLQRTCYRVGACFRICGCGLPLRRIEFSV